MPRPVVLLALAVLLAGCASEGAEPTPTTSGGALPTPTSTSTPAPTPAPTVPSPPPVTLGVVLDETHDYTGPATQRFFNVTGAEKAVVINITSSGPPADKSFQSATLNFYFPTTTSPFLGELPGQEAHTFEVRQQAHRGMWKVEFLGTGKVTVQVRVTLE